MRILVAIANHGTGNRQHLERLITEYRSMPWLVDIVVLSNVAKSIAADVTVRVGVPTSNPWSLPFAHRDLFHERRNDYDLFIYSEDDTLVTAINVAAFMRASQTLGPAEIAGFMRTETDQDGNQFVPSVHGDFRWDPREIVERSGELFATFTNEHSACYLATRDHLHRAIASGGFMVEPYEGRYDMLCTAATDIYTRCGLKRYVPVSRIHDFLLPHLPNKYIGKMGVPLSEVLAQTTSLQRLYTKSGWKGPLVSLENGLRPGPWSKDLYEPVDHALVQIVPRGDIRLLSVGCGWGATEEALAAGGAVVTAMPIDPVFGDALRRRRIVTREGTFEQALQELGDSQFDVVVLKDILHLAPDPIAWLRGIRPVLKPPSGRLILSVPQPRDPVEYVKSIGSATRRDIDRMPSAISSRTLRRWLRHAAFKDVAVKFEISDRRKAVVKASLGLLGSTLATRFLVTAR